MGTKYSSVTISGYNASPPPDDGSTGADNQVTWAKHKDKLGDPVKTAVESINTALVTALDQSSRSITGNDSTLSTDHLKTIEIAATVSTSVVTLSLADAASMANGYIVNVVNRSAYAQTISRVTTSNGINGTTTSVPIPSLASICFAVNSGATGYNSVGGTTAWGIAPITLFPSPLCVVKANTTDGADNGALLLCHGTFSGSPHTARGASVSIYGNDHANSGGVFIVAGDVAGAVASLGTAGNTLRVMHAGDVHIGDSSNANSTLGLTINQGGADDQAFTLKSSDVAHGLTSGGQEAMETDDFFSIQKMAAAEGGVKMQVTCEDGGSAAQVLRVAVNGGTAQTTDTTASVGLVNIETAEHNGSNAQIASPANSNAFTIRSATAAATFATRLLLKADDGELHLGNTTLVALDSEDDIAAVRGLQMVRTEGRGITPTEYDRPAYSYDKLRELGIVGEKDERGEFLIRVQPYLNLHDGALWQLYTMMRDQAEELAVLKQKLLPKAGQP